jgi:pimeloyl-ACP methyl ester carboxylesterase
MARVGVFGHSFGGAQAAQFCHEDARCKAGIDIDGAPLGSVVQTGIDRPFMFLMSDHSRESGPESSRIMANIQSIYDRLPANGRRLIVIRGANHFTFSDDGAFLKSRVLRGVLRLFGKLRIDGRRQIEITAYCVRSFFDTYLGASAIRSSSTAARKSSSFSTYAIRTSLLPRPDA